MDIQPVLAAIDAMSPSERQQIRVHLELLEGGQLASAPGRVADSAEVQRTARELMTRFPESMRKLAGRP